MLMSSGSSPAAINVPFVMSLSGALEALSKATGLVAASGTASAPSPSASSGDRPACSICGKDFSTTWHLRVHMRGHTNERPYGCSVCDKTFLRSDHLCRHMRNVHKVNPNSSEVTWLMEAMEDQERDRVALK
ncbi:hypothetical protein BIW11_13176 [Tropilaelaps mercedesae]|uniref:C2H2-type domain-containing protein n=1 Tax=Tropilaelaps mercedesae TaxID=418985 RepID=A0A1V9X302_9ACAR|nr:hypothetical protein BIW11_13176 [Tropilaelaps mercedesae]